MAGKFEARTLPSFTVQFWLKLRPDHFTKIYQSDNIDVVATVGLSSIGETQEITFLNEQITHGGNPLTYTLFTPVQDGASLNNTITFFTSNSSKQIGVIHRSPLGFSIKYTTTNITLSYANEWNLITIAKDLSTLKIYKNLELEPKTLTQAFTSINLNGLYLYTNEYDIGHISVYDRQLSESEVLNNYNSFKSMYQQNL